ncbi:hypothetical protein ACGFIJ_20270 [Microbispora bryophytorum]|uniref:Uncharacterized protein n=1 Tax=Microbispora bryophytorum TaxID=1460882 RepID=A0A8H9H0A8_9ACTN|nr:hypothetical protein [Microbispora bryophytorum]MBD3139677.1 hypothetical protein [Microbispora bryophytorum]TQS02959.1 hypothetical protein FLX07_26935 [Microbispora bryophytorum]GGO03269.1 hypothetical protein GCM10011574_12920 [Microbispora bryophytorum]
MTLTKPEEHTGLADLPEPDVKAGVIDLLERGGSVVVPVGIALYALLYLGIQQVYGIFNISPEQAGIDQATMFGRLVGTLILLVIAGALLAGVFVAAVWLLDKATLGHMSRLTRAVRVRPWAAATAGALWCGVSYWGFLGYLGLGEGVSMAGVVITAAVIGALAFLVPFRLLRRRPAGRAGMKIVVAAFTGIGLGFALMGQMESDAIAVAEKGRPASLLLSMVGFQDQWVVLNDRESGKVLRGGAEVLLLGEREGTYALYDCAHQETFRISMEATVLRQVTLEPERPSGYSCLKQEN